MQPLEMNRRVLRWFCLYPANDDADRGMKLFYVMNAVVHIMVSLAGISASAVFFWKWVSIDIELALYAFWQIVLHVMLTYAFTVLLFSRSKIKWTFETLFTIYDTSKDQLSSKNIGKNWAQNVQFIFNSRRKGWFISISNPYKWHLRMAVGKIFENNSSCFFLRLHASKCDFGVNLLQ